MTPVLIVAHVLSLGSAALLALAVGTSIARRWSLALRSARVCTLVALALVVGPILVTSVGVGSPAFMAAIMKDAAGNPPDPSDRARVLAQTISELMNATALGTLAGILAVPIWILARVRLRKAQA